MPDQGQAPEGLSSIERLSRFDRFTGQKGYPVQPGAAGPAPGAPVGRQSGSTPTLNLGGLARPHPAAVAGATRAGPGDPHDAAGVARAHPGGPAELAGGHPGDPHDAAGVARAHPGDPHDAAGVADPLAPPPFTVLWPPERLGTGGKGGQGRGSGRQRRRPGLRYLVIAAGAAAAVIMVIAWFAFPGLRASFAQGAVRPTAQTGSGLVAAPAAVPGHQGTGSGHPAAGQSGAASRAGGPLGSPGATGQPSPRAAAPGAPPAGYAWLRVPPQVSGTVAGFSAAVPASWTTTSTGAITRVAAGTEVLTFDLRTFPVTPAAEALFLQAALRASGSAPGYHLIALTPGTYQGWPSATWDFRWKPTASIGFYHVTSIIFQARTPAGTQDYVISISSTAPQQASAASVLRTAEQTFTTVP